MTMSTLNTVLILARVHTISVIETHVIHIIRNTETRMEELVKVGTVWPIVKAIWGILERAKGATMGMTIQIRVVGMMICGDSCSLGQRTWEKLSRNYSEKAIIFKSKDARIYLGTRLRERRTKFS